MNLFYFLTPKAEVAYLYNDFTLRQALEKMEYHRYSSIPILNRAGEYVGTVTEGDLLWFIKNNAGLDLSSAEDTPLMSIPRKHDYACVPIDTDIDHLIHAAMLCARHRRQKQFYRHCKAQCTDSILLRAVPPGSAACGRAKLLRLSGEKLLDKCSIASYNITCRKKRQMSGCSAVW